MDASFLKGAAAGAAATGVVLGLLWRAKQSGALASGTAPKGLVEEIIAIQESSDRTPLYKEPTKLDLSIDELVAVLPHFFGDGGDPRAHNHPVVVNLMRRLKYDGDEWRARGYVWHDKRYYTRNVIASKPYAFDLIAICWDSDQHAPIHDHAQSGCFMRVCEGALTETRWTTKGKADSAALASKAEQWEDCSDGTTPVKMSEDTYESPSVFYISNKIGLHSVDNNSKTVPAVSLHLYSPPIAGDVCWKEDGDSYSLCYSKMVFHSYGGVRVPQHMYRLPEPGTTHPDTPLHIIGSAKRAGKKWLDVTRRRSAASPRKAGADSPNAAAGAGGASSP